MKFSLLLVPLGIGVPARTIINRAEQFLVASGVPVAEVEELKRAPRQMIDRARREMRAQTGQELLPIPVAAGITP
jgi:hypothetical protein